MNLKMNPKNWQSAASIILDTCYDIIDSGDIRQIPDQEACLDFVDQSLANIVSITFNSFGDNEELEDEFFSIAAAGIIGLSNSAEISKKAAINKIFSTVVDKQKMYGPNNICKFGMHGIVIRLNDKIERMKNLKQHDGPVLFEPIQDTWLDIVGYSVLALMWINDWFLLEFKAQSKTNSH